MPDFPTPQMTMFYMGRKLETFTKEELIKIAEEGWRNYHEALDTGIRSTRLMRDLYIAEMHTRGCKCFTS